VRPALPVWNVSVVEWTVLEHANPANQDTTKIQNHLVDARRVGSARKEKNVSVAVLAVQEHANLVGRDISHLAHRISSAFDALLVQRDNSVTVVEDQILEHAKTVLLARTSQLLEPGTRPVLLVHPATRDFRAKVVLEHLREFVSPAVKECGRRKV